MKTNKLLMPLAFACLLFSLNAKSASQTVYHQKPLFMLAHVQNAAQTIKRPAVTDPVMEPVYVIVPDDQPNWEIVYDDGFTTYTFDTNSQTNNTNYLGEVPVNDYYRITVTALNSYYPPYGSFVSFDFDIRYWKDNGSTYFDRDVYSDINPVFATGTVYPISVNTLGEQMGLGDGNWVVITQDNGL